MAATKCFHVRYRRQIPLRQASWALAALGVLGSRMAYAQSYVDFRYLNYQESDGRTEVREPMLTLHQDLGASLGQIDLTVIQDAISGASPTGAYPTVTTSTVPSTSTSTPSTTTSTPASPIVTTSASGTVIVSGGGGGGGTVGGGGSVSGGGTTSSSQIPMVNATDNRKAFTIGYSRAFGAHTPSLNVSYSTENDYISHGFGLSDAWTMLDGRGTLHYGVSLSNDTVEPVTTHVKHSKTTHSFALGWTWVIGENDVVDISTTQSRLQGYLDEPYKMVPVGSTLQWDHRPDSRSRQAYLLKYAHYVPGWDGGFNGSYRFYKDDWGVRATTIDISYGQHLSSNWVLTPRVRRHQQDAATFYAGSFSEAQPYMSADYRLSKLDSTLYGLDITWSVTPKVQIMVGATSQETNGHDRLVPVSTTPGGAGWASLSPADVTTKTFTFGFKWMF